MQNCALGRSLDDSMFNIYAPLVCDQRCATFKTQESTGLNGGTSGLHLPAVRQCACRAHRNHQIVVSGERGTSVNTMEGEQHVAPPHSNDGEHMSSLKWHDNTALMARISVSKTPISEDDSDDLSPPRKTLPPRSTPARLLGTMFVLPLWHLDACLLQRKRHPARRLRLPLSSMWTLVSSNENVITRKTIPTTSFLNEGACLLQRKRHPARRLR